EINVIGLGSIDQFTFLKPKNATIEQLAILDQIPLNSQQTHTMGISWRHTLPKGFWQLVVSRNQLENRADKFEGNDASSESKRILGYRSTETENRVRYELNFPWAGLQWSAGTHLILSGYENNTFQRRLGQDARYQTDFSMWRYGGFVSATAKLFRDKVTLTAGLRTDGNSYLADGGNLGKQLSPRLSATVSITDQLNGNFSLARYYKIPPYTILGFQENGVQVNKNVDYIRSDHYVAGLEWLPSSTLRFTVEGFYKSYSQYPVSSVKGISMANFGGDFGVFGNERIVSSGKGRTYGMEFLFQQRLTKNFYGILAYTYYFSEFSGFDPVTKLPTPFGASAWDNRHLLSFTGGYRLKKYWEVGLRFRFQGKAPYTPIDIPKSLDYYPFLAEPVLNYARLNGERLDPFHAADLRIDKKFNFRKWSLDLFLDIQNVYNSTNPIPPGFTLKRNADESIATTTGEAYNPGNYFNPNATNNRQSAIPVLLPADSGSFLPSIGFVV
ncbi:MAG: TonB-dependent receptor plug domain-containing protein, partial [Chitinophagaceae bacterium]